MIGLLIQDNAYEQDIRELLMSFYPGETYAHEVKDGVAFYVESRLGALLEKALKSPSGNGRWKARRQTAILICLCPRGWRAGG